MNVRYADVVLALCTMAFFVTYFGRLAISPVVPLITDDFAVSNAQIGLTLTGMWLAYGLAQFPSGILADRYGEKPIILIAVGGTAIASLTIAFAPLFTLFVLATVLLGGVAGLHYSVATTLLSRTYDEFGAAIGLHSSGGPLAGLTTPIVVAWVGVRYGWRPAIALTAVVAVPVLVLFVRVVRPTEPRLPNRPMRERFATGTLTSLLARPPIAFTLAIAILGTFVAQGLISFIPTFVVKHHGRSPTVAAVVFSGYFVVRGGVQIGVGAVSDRYGRDLSLAVCLLAGAAGIALFVVGTGLPAIAVASVLVGVGSSFFAALDPRFMDRLADEERGTGFGMVRTIYGIVGAAGSVVVGLLADHFGWGVSFSVLAILSLVAFAGLCANRLFGLDY